DTKPTARDVPVLEQGGDNAINRGSRNDEHLSARAESGDAKAGTRNVEDGSTFLGGRQMHVQDDALIDATARVAQPFGAGEIDHAHAPRHAASSVCAVRKSQSPSLGDSWDDGRRRQRLCQSQQGDIGASVTTRDSRIDGGAAGSNEYKRFFLGQRLFG